MSWALATAMARILILPSPGLLFSKALYEDVPLWYNVLYGGLSP
jgi:hypothetical protein